MDKDAELELLLGRRAKIEGADARKSREHEEIWPHMNVLPEVATHRSELAAVETADRAKLSRSREVVSLEKKNAPRKIDERRLVRELVVSRPLSSVADQDLIPAAQRYKLLATRVLATARNLRSQVFLVTSATPEEGKSLTTLNLAYALSSVEGKRVLVVELDLRRPSMHRLLGLSALPEEETFLAREEDWHDSLWSLRPNFHALLAINPSSQPDELLHSAGMVKFLAEARKEYDIILIDSVPLMAAVDTHVLIPMVDQAMLVVRADQTPIECAQDALKILGNKALGCVLNDVKRMKYEDYYRGYYDNQKRS